MALERAGLAFAWRDRAGGFLSHSGGIAPDAGPLADTDPASASGSAPTAAARACSPPTGSCRGGGGDLPKSSLATVLSNTSKIRTEPIALQFGLRPAAMPGFLVK